MKFGDLVSERMIFGILVIGGYFTVVIAGTHLAKDNISSEAAAIIHDAMLTGGPLVGIIVNSIWKSDKADKANAATMASLASTVAAQSPNPTQPTPNAGPNP